eukprot:scaffold710_cov186-Alexandrium_tamarense.AAC.2
MIVDVTASIHFNIDRRDAAIYFSQSGHQITMLSTGKCNVQALGQKMADAYPNDNRQNDRIFQGNVLDSCFDVLPAGDGKDYMFEFEQNMKVPCDDLSVTHIPFRLSAKARKVLRLPTNPSRNCMKPSVASLSMYSHDVPTLDVVGG